ncbi:MAG: pilus assembly protein PilM [Vicinamibacterales bacterium]
MSRFWSSTRTADAAVEITGSRVSAAVLSVRGGRPAIESVAAERLPTGTVTPAFASLNIHDAAALTAALGSVTARLGARIRSVALVVPDAVARVSLVRFDQVPPRRDDLAQLVHWQVRKGVPFPADEARVSFVPGAGGGAGHEFLVAVARAGVVAEYEQACARAGLHAGIVDVASTAVLNLRLAGGPISGDWLLVHVREDASTVAVLRGGDVLFVRTRTADDQSSVDQSSVGDFVHQAVMYYQDRLEGAGFQSVYVAGSGSREWPIDIARRDIEERLNTPARLLEASSYVAVPSNLASLVDDPRDVLTTLAGMTLRAREQAAVA